jgi:hypothetical protein
VNDINKPNLLRPYDESILASSVISEVKFVGLEAITATRSRLVTIDFASTRGVQQSSEIGPCRASVPRKRPSYMSRDEQGTSLSHATAFLQRQSHQLLQRQANLGSTRSDAAKRLSDIVFIIAGDTRAESDLDFGVAHRTVLTE